MSATEALLLAVGILQWAIGAITGYLYADTRANQKLRAAEEERDALWDEFHGRSA